MKIINIAVVIPCFSVSNQILSVIKAIPKCVKRIYVVDDACPEKTGQLVKSKCKDKRVIVINHKKNQGVGASVITGYKIAINDGADLIVKVDGDGQMDPNLIPLLITPILSGEADYTKGNRFFNLRKIKNMPKVRIFGNAILSFMSKISSGYWDIIDPTNGFTAIHCKIVKHIPLDKIDQRYFFETDMLFRLNTIRAVVLDIPMDSFYGNEKSNLKINKIVTPFIIGHLRNFIKRIIYNYYLRGFSAVSVSLIIAFFLLLFSFSFGLLEWIKSVSTGKAATSGTVMLAAIPMVLGFQLILSFINYDIANIPKNPLHKLL